MKRKAPADIFPKRARIVKKQALRNPNRNPAIVETNCSDKLSLFSAVCVGMYYYENGGGEWRSAGRYAKGSHLSSKAIHLEALVYKTLEPESYGMDDVKKVCEYLEETFPATYRILVFTNTSDTKTVYNSGNNSRYNICLYYHDGHFDLIKAPQKFFQKKHYCVDCEKTYEDLKNHSDCKIRCQQCFRIGYGYPCKGELDLECQDCHKLFPTMDCMIAHKPYSCSTYHRCAYCNVVYRVRPERPSKGHSCAKAPATASVASEPTTLPDTLQYEGLR